jgi:hypothetical protein
MNKIRFHAIFYVSFILALASCGSNQSNESTESTTADSTAASTNNESVTAPSTIVNTPENMIVVTHKVANFSKWKASYDEHDSVRLAFGVHSYVIGRSIEDTNMVMVALKVDDMEKAKAFSKDPSLKKAMQKGGVVGAPTVQFTTMVYQDTAKIDTRVRSRTTFTVKDFDAWRKTFESHKQTRIDNGLTDRAFGHDANDDHKVTLVVAVNDTAKARAFWKSDLLKQQRAESGVTSQPQRFVYTVVQRY